jgi:hypothetical protein
MSHSRILQLKPECITADSNLITADDFIENTAFLGPIADCISDGCDRREDFISLAKHLKNIIGTGNEENYSWLFAENGAKMPEAYIIFRPGFKKAYFQNKYEAFIKRAGAMTLENFMSEEYIWQLENVICDDFDFYIAEDAFNIEPLDKFIRSLPDDDECKLWLWATVDYHF